jgi:hypothetical protein
MHRGPNKTNLLTTLYVQDSVRVVENLQSIEDEGEIYESMEEIWRITLTNIFGMRMNIKYIIKEKVSKRLFFLVKFIK